MGNRETAKELREKQAAANKADTQTAMASQTETEAQAQSIVKIQEDLENLKLLLADTNKAKEELEQELEEVKKENASLHALVNEKQKQIDALKASNEALNDENEKLKATPKKEVSHDHRETEAKSTDRHK